MITEKRTKKTPYRISWDKYVDATEYITALEGKLSPVLDSIISMEGCDMYMSDYSKLVEVHWLIRNKGD